MGLITETRSAPGSVPRTLLQSGLLGRGVIVSVQPTAITAGPHRDAAHVCVFTVEVELDSVPPYSATCRQAVPATILPRLMLPGATVPVRVDPGDHSRIALSMSD